MMLEEMLGKIIDYFKQFDNLFVIGIVFFGLIEICCFLLKYGYIIDMLKLGWLNVDFVGLIKKVLNVLIVWMIDVNGFVYGEYLMVILFNCWIYFLVYFIIGIGVGGGVVIDGYFVGEQGYIEMGYICVKCYLDDLDFKGICLFYGDCLEGLVVGLIFDVCLGKLGKELLLIDYVWDIMVYYVV